MIATKSNKTQAQMVQALITNRAFVSETEITDLNMKDRAAYLTDNFGEEEIACQYHFMIGK